MRTCEIEFLNAKRTESSHKNGMRSNETNVKKKVVPNLERRYLGMTTSVGQAGRAIMFGVKGTRGGRVGTKCPPYDCSGQGSAILARGHKVPTLRIECLGTECPPYVLNAWARSAQLTVALFLWKWREDGAQPDHGRVLELPLRRFFQVLGHQAPRPAEWLVAFGVHRQGGAAVIGAHAE